MSYRLSEMLTAINAALNYPAITYDDVAVYLDMCIGEINTTLHTSIRSFREYIRRSRERELSSHRVQTLSNEPTGEHAGVNIADEVEDLENSVWNYWTESKDHPEWYGKFIMLDSKGNVSEVANSAFAVHVKEGIPHMYEAHAYSKDLCIWVAASEFGDIDVEEFLTEDWVNMFVIPYVCFKYTCRDGGTASTFAEEMEQGFQQLQETYDVPSKVRMSEVAGMPAYTDDVKKALQAGIPNMNMPTRAITDRMKHARNVLPTYGSLYDAGGFGV